MPVLTAIWHSSERSRLILFENSTQMLAVFTIYTSSQVVQPEKCFVLRGTICCTTHSFPSRLHRNINSAECYVVLDGRAVPLLNTKYNTMHRSSPPGA